MKATNAEVLTLLADPDRLDSVPRESIPALIGAVATLHAELWARLQSGATPAAETPSRNGASEQDRLLTAPQAAELLGVADRWMYRHADELPFTRRLTGGTLRFSARGLERWKETKR